MSKSPFSEPNPYPPISGVPHDDMGYPITHKAFEPQPGIDWDARLKRALRWRVQGALLSETPYPTHEPRDDDIPSPKPRNPHKKTTF